MSCPAEKPRSSAAEGGSSGIPPVARSRKIGGMTWRPVSGPPQVGELYYLPEREDIGLAYAVDEWEGRTWVAIRTLGQAYNAPFAPDAWLERADRPDPLWSSPPVELPAARITNARYEIIGAHLIEQSPHVYRANLINGDFLVVLQGAQAVACLFDRQGRRAAGMAAAGETPEQALKNLEQRLDQSMKVSKKRKKAHFDPLEGERLVQSFQGDYDRLKIEQRLAAGESVPLDVLLAYPDLLERYGL